MKIAYLSADSGIAVFGRKGASVHIREMANALCAVGHRVTILAPSLGPVTDPLSAEVIEVRVDGSPMPIVAEPSPLASGGVSNAELENTIARERRSLQLSTSVLDRLFELHARERFDLIYERYSLWSAAGVRAARELKIPCLIEVNAPLDEQRRFRQLALASEAEAIEAEVFRGADVLVTVSEQLKSYAVAKGADPKRTFVLPNGVDIKRFHPAVDPEPMEGLNGRFVLGFVGSFKPWHGIEVLLDAFRTFVRRSPAYHLLLVGDGPLRNWIEGYIRGAQLDGTVSITGWMPYERLPGFIQRMDVAVAPYPPLERFYFSPLKLFEYMAMGKPVVASDIGQISELIRDETTGLLVRPGDPEDLVAKIERLHAEPGLRSRLGTAASREAVQHTWERNAQRVLALAASLVTAG